MVFRNKTRGGESGLKLDRKMAKFFISVETIMCEGRKEGRKGVNRMSPSTLKCLPSFPHGSNEAEEELGHHQLHGERGAM